jgi:hypothetical protein
MLVVNSKIGLFMRNKLVLFMALPLELKFSDFNILEKNSYYSYFWLIDFYFYFLLKI